ncbi:synaptojanin-2-binding protein [Columba livia]|uniref:Synaptojanin-2-binding protein n=1 Tax=Columba livia TaxID=8932 RepID=A0A2I0MND5_COLLI|nr:synaptojanin-2-binding protein [Columba livia]
MARGGYAAAGKAGDLREGELAGSGFVLGENSGQEHPLRLWSPLKQLSNNQQECLNLWAFSHQLSLWLTLGLGFNIVGGTDQQYLSNDSSIYVSRIKKDGAAYLDGRLQEGDKILAVNGKDLKDLRHKDAVEMFRNAGCDVSLRIQRRLQPQNGPVGHRGDGESGGLPLAAVLVPGLALAAAAVWILLRSDGSVCWQDMAEPRGPKTSAE